MIEYFFCLDEPEITQGNNEFDAVEGSTITLPCNVKGDPKPAIIWFKDNVEVVSSDNLHLKSDGSLKLNKVLVKDEGEYVCSATNIVGTSDQTLKLTIKGGYFIYFFK